MSDFERKCRDCGYVSYGRIGDCEECGSKATYLYTMDGKTRKECDMIDRIEEKIKERGNWRREDENIWRICARLR